MRAVTPGAALTGGLGGEGPAYTATVYSLSPLLTMTFAAVVRIEKMFLRRFLAITIGFLGMLVLIQQQIREIDLGQSFWVIFGLLIPTSAAMGNVVGSASWPKGPRRWHFQAELCFHQAQS